MNYLKKMTALMLIGCFFQSSCEAAGIYNVKYDTDSGQAVISGNTAQPNVNVTLEVLKRGNQSDSLKNLQPENAGNVILRYDQCLSNDEGSFEFSFKLPEGSESGEYVTRVSWGGTAADNRLIYISSADFADALSAINKASEEEMGNAVENAVQKLGLNNQYYTNLSPKEKSFIVSVVKEKRGTGYESAEDFALVFSEVLAIASVNSIASGYDALATTEYFEDILKLKKLVAYATFDKQLETVKKQIIEAVSEEGRAEKVETCRERFEEKTVLFSLNNVQGYDKVIEILQDNNHILNIDFTEYNKLSNKSAVNKKMIEKKFNSLKEIADTFNSIVALEKKAGSSSSSSNSGGGGGGGRGGALPTTLVENKNNITTPSTSTEKGFSDLSSVEWARESIESLAEKNIVSGKGNNLFEPMSAVTRAEFIKMLVIALGIENNAEECDFEDVPKDAWFYPYVASAVKSNLVYGITDKLFGSTENISKQDIATLLLRAGENSGIDFDDTQAKTFKDYNDISDYAIESVEKLSAAGIITGTDTGCFEPKKSATRAEAAVMIVKFLDLLEDR